MITPGPVSFAYGGLDPPTMTGGPIADGTYTLTRGTCYSSAGCVDACASGTFERVDALRFTGTNYERVAGNCPTPHGESGVFAAADGGNLDLQLSPNVLALAPKCGDAEASVPRQTLPSGNGFVGTFRYSSDGGVLSVLSEHSVTLRGYYGPVSGSEFCLREYVKR